MAGAPQRRAAIQEMFRIVESKYGDFASLARRRPPEYAEQPVLTVPALTREALTDLFAHRVAAVRVPGFYPVASAQHLAARLVADPDIARMNWQVSVAGSRGLESTDVTAVGGTPHNVAAGADAGGSAGALDAYFDAALPAMRQLRRMEFAAPSSSAATAATTASAAASAVSAPPLSSFLPPIDQLRLELDEVWGGGATVAKDAKTGRAHMAGIGRIVRGPTQWEQGFCHADDLGVMSPGTGTFSANVYLQMPRDDARTGAACGALHVWDIQVGSRWDFYRHAYTLSQLTAQCAEGQARLRAMLPPPLTIVPEVGELVLICVQRPHAVDGFREGTRVSQQCFLSVEKGKPIRLDS